MYEYEANELKSICKEAFKCGVNDVNGYSYTYDLTECVIKMNNLLNDYVHTNIISEVTYIAEDTEYKMGGIVNASSIVDAISTLKNKDVYDKNDGFSKRFLNRKYIDKRTKEFKKLEIISKIINFWYHQGVFYATDDLEWVSVKDKDLEKLL